MRRDREGEGKSRDRDQDGEGKERDPEQEKEGRSKHRDKDREVTSPISMSRNPNLNGYCRSNSHRCVAVLL